MAVKANARDGLRYEVLVVDNNSSDATAALARKAGAEVVFESALAVILLDFSAKRFVALDHVEHVAQHFEHRAVGFGADRGRARVEAHAGHFAEELEGRTSKQMEGALAT